MSILAQPTISTTEFARLSISGLLSLIITFLLFLLMHQLTEREDMKHEKQKNTVVIDLAFTPETPKVIKRSPVKPPPKMLRQPPRTPLTEPKVSSESQIFNHSSGVISPNIPNTFSLRSNLSNDGNSRPVVRITPKYPAMAARDGIEGWVKMSFTIDQLGNVTDIVVIDANPKRVFDKEARRALSKWKYTPKLVNGTPVTQGGLEIQLDFILQE